MALRRYMCLYEHAGPSIRVRRRAEFVKNYVTDAALLLLMYFWLFHNACMSKILWDFEHWNDNVQLHEKICISSLDSSIENAIILTVYVLPSIGNFQLSFHHQIFHTPITRLSTQASRQTPFHHPTPSRIGQGLNSIRLDPPFSSRSSENPI